ncbi:MAG: GNAT family N-acetyltransferase [Chloroflexota bacterium]|nr:GNAT family N-acetyltransferase [Chloroflexota bacterium]
MRIRRAQLEDVPGWLALAAEVESLFGPLVEDAEFHRALRKNIARGTAYCVREGDGPPGTPLAGGLLFSPRPPAYRLGWLAVAGGWRRRGVGRALVEHALGLVRPPAEIVVVTFGEDNAAGQPARRFYERLGFQPAEPAPAGPEGGSRQVYRRVIG